MTFLLEKVNERGADETGTARDKDFHGMTLVKIGVKSKSGLT